MEDIYTVAKFKENKELEREFNFRVNTILLIAIFYELKKKLPKEIKIKDINQNDMNNINDEYFYKMLSTNRVTYNKYMNGHIKKPTKHMLKAVSHNQDIYQALEGKFILDFGSLDKSFWIRKFNDYNFTANGGKIDIVSEDIAKVLEIIFNNYSPEKREFRVVEWVIRKIAYMYSNSHDNAPTLSKLKQFSEVTFQELDNCSYIDLKQMHEKLEKTWSNYVSIYNYKARRQ